MNPPRPFVVLATQRTGSTWLVDLLDDHPEVVCYSELFLSAASGRPTWGGSKNLVFHAASGMDVAHYLDVVFAPRTGVQAVGCKLMYEQVGAAGGLLSEVRRRRVRVLHLWRRNVLRAVVSAEVATARDVFHSRGGAALSLPTVRINVGELIDRIERAAAVRERWRKTVDALGLAVHELTYEHLCADSDVALEGAFTFLGVDETVRPTSGLVRIIREPLSKLVGNLDAVHAVLEGTAHAWMLEDDAPT